MTRAWITRVIHLCNWLTLAVQIEHAILLRNSWLVMIKFVFTVSVASFIIEQSTFTNLIVRFRRNHIL